jgi:hypothetical protein
MKDLKSLLGLQEILTRDCQKALNIGRTPPQTFAFKWTTFQPRESTNESTKCQAREGNSKGEHLILVMDLNCDLDYNID